MKKLFGFFLLFSFGVAQAQDFEVGVAGGVSLYSGDLAPEEFGVYFDNLHTAFGVFGRWGLSKNFSVRAGINFAKVSADDLENGRPERALNFRSNILELAVTGEFNLFQIDVGRTAITPFIYGGMGLFRFSPEARFDGNYVELQPLGTEGQGLPQYDAPYKLTQINVPVGVGVKFTFNDSWSLGFEFGGRKLFTDYLDDVSDTEVNFRDVLDGNGQLAASLSNPTLKDPEQDELIYTRGSAAKDWYYIGSITLSFKIGGGGLGRSGKGIGCPTF